MTYRLVELKINERASCDLKASKQVEPSRLGSAVMLAGVHALLGVQVSEALGLWLGQTAKCV